MQRSSHSTKRPRDTKTSTQESRRSSSSILTASSPNPSHNALLQTKRKAAGFSRSGGLLYIIHMSITAASYNLVITSKRSSFLELSPHWHGYDSQHASHPSSQRDLSSLPQSSPPSSQPIYSQSLRGKDVPES